MLGGLSGGVLGDSLLELVEDLAKIYVAGRLVIVAGAGVSRASGLPAWSEMIDVLQSSVANDLKTRISPAELDTVLASLHRGDPISRADSLQRLVRETKFRKHLFEALYPARATDRYQPSVLHWHIASMVDRTLMPDAFTSNYDDLMEDAKMALGRSGRVRHFHGRLPQGWSGSSRLYDPPVVSSRDYMAAEEKQRYENLARALRDKTALLVGFSLSDPNLTRVIRNEAQDCRALLVASPRGLSISQQALRLDLLRRYWQDQNVAVTAVEAHEELPAFLLALRRAVQRLQGASPSRTGARAFRASATTSPSTWTGARLWRDRLQDAVVAAKDVGSGTHADRSLRAGFYAITDDGELEHVVSSATKREQMTWPRRRLRADDPRPWGAAGYAYAAGVPVVSSSVGAAFDRNVPESELLSWQAERSAQKRLPASAVLCTPAWVRFGRRLTAVGVLYFSSRRGAAFEDPRDSERLTAILQVMFGDMLKPERSIPEGTS